MSTDNKASLLPHQPDPALLEAFRYINAMPGKDVRGKLIDCFQSWMKVESADVLNSIKVRLICAFDIISVSKSIFSSYFYI